MSIIIIYMYIYTHTKRAKIFDIYTERGWPGAFN
jgi:hypothetical protein